MRKKILFVLCTLMATCISLRSFAVANPGVDSATIIPSPVMFPGGTAVFQFDLKNEGTATSSSFVKFRISLQFLNFTGNVFNQATDIERVSGTANFNWVYLPATNTLEATLNGTLNANSRTRFRIKNLNVTQDSPDPANPSIGGNINITTPAAVNSSTSNDNAFYRTYSIPPNPLPISLLSFSAFCNQGKTVIRWVTASEQNNAQFVVSRSANLTDWTPVALLAGAGNSNQELHYEMTDERPLQGLSYYRLTQQDYDGKSETFAPVSIACDGDGISNSMFVFPNPAAEQFTVAINTSLDLDGALTEIEIFNLEGKKVAAKSIALSKGVTQTTFDRNGLAAGQYFVRINSGYLSLKPIVVILQ